MVVMLRIGHTAIRNSDEIITLSEKSRNNPVGKSVQIHYHSVFGLCYF